MPYWILFIIVGWFCDSAFLFWAGIFFWMIG
jgi:hypothetical protein